MMRHLIEQIDTVMGAAPLEEESAGSWVMEKLLSSSQVRKIRKMSGDDQTGELAMEVWRELVRRIDAALANGGEEAINRLSAQSNFQKDDTGLTRNNVFKAANALGMKLPSPIF